LFYKIAYFRAKQKVAQNVAIALFPFSKSSPNV
jgi:hypothetical protein